MRAVRVRSRHFNGRRPNGLISVIRLRDKSSSGGAYARDKNTSAELCAKNAGGGRICGTLRYMELYGTTNNVNRMIYMCYTRVVSDSAVMERIC